MQVAFPQMLVGRIIGKGGATIREMEARSRAKVSVAEGKGGPGMATLVVVGDERAGARGRVGEERARGRKLSPDGRARAARRRRAHLVQRVALVDARDDHDDLRRGDEKDERATAADSSTARGSGAMPRDREVRLRAVV